MFLAGSENSVCNGRTLDLASYIRLDGALFDLGGSPHFLRTSRLREAVEEEYVFC